jgi:hypothetical protein
VRVAGNVWGTTEATEMPAGSPTRSTRNTHDTIDFLHHRIKCWPDHNFHPQEWFLGVKEVSFQGHLGEKPGIEIHFSETVHQGTGETKDEQRIKPFHANTILHQMIPYANPVDIKSPP